MKQTKRWMAVLLACAILIANIPALFVFAGSTDALELTTLENFTGNSGDYSVSDGAVLSVSDSTAVGDGKMLKVDPGTTGSWSKVKLTVPLDNTAVGTAQGLLIYTEWTDHNNFYVKLNASQDGATVTTGPVIWTQPPIYDVQSNAWTIGGESDNADMLKIGSKFKGYVYLPFAILSTSLTSSATLTSIEIEGFNTGTNTGYAIGSIYLVKNAVLPTRADGTEELPTDVVLDDEKTTLIKRVFDGIELATLEDFTKQGSYSITQNGTTLSGASATVIDNVGTVGSGKALSVDLNNDDSWALAYVSIPLSFNVDSTKGLLVYTEWGTNKNLYFRLSGTGASGVAVATPKSTWSEYPVYDVGEDVWKASLDVGTNLSYGLTANFKGYIYIPFDRLTATLTAVDRLEIGAFRADGCAKFTIGGVWLVENDRIPSAYATGIGNKVLLDEVTETTLSNKPLDVSALIAEYNERLNAIKIDDLLYTQEGLALMKAKLSELEIALRTAQTKKEQEALITVFDKELEAFIAGPTPDFTLAAISDIHLRVSGGNLTRFKQFLKDVNTAAPETEAVLVAGDLTENGSAEEFEVYWNTLSDRTPDGTVVLSAMGNHDARGDFLGSASKASRWEKAKTRYLSGLNAYLGTDYTDMYYHQEIGGYDFLVMNTEDADKDTATISQKQQDWLKARLTEISAAKPGQPIFVMLHQPLTATHPGTTNLDSTVGASGKTLRAIIADYPQVVYLSGHVHNGVGYSDIINDGKGIFLDLPSSENNTRGNTSLTLVYYVSVYGDVLRFRVRDFSTGEWLEAYEYRTKLTDVDPVDKDELRKAYYLYRTTGKGRYSENTWNTFAAALEEAHVVLNDLSASQTVVDETLKTLQATVDGLEIEPLKLAADNEAMKLKILQDFAGFDASGVVSGSDGASAVIKDGSQALDAVNTLSLTSSVDNDTAAQFTVPFKAGANLDGAEGLLAYLRLPAAKSGGVVGVRLWLDTVELTGAKLSYLDNTSQSWVELPPASDGTYSFPTGFEGYVRLNFADMPEDRKETLKTAQAVGLSCGAIGADKEVWVGGIYAITKDTAGLTALIGEMTERYLVNGKEPTEELDALYKASMKAETLHSFKGYTVGESALSNLVSISGANKNDITITYADSLGGITPGNVLAIDADSMHSFWPGDGATEEWAYIKVSYPENAYLDNMAALMFYVETPAANPYSEDPFTAKIFFDMHTVGTDGSGVWSNTASYETLYFLAEGSTEWQRLESDTGHILLPTDTKGYVLAPIESFSTNPISTSLEGRKLLDTTFIISGFGGDMGETVIGGIWSVMDLGNNNLLLSFNGAEVWNLSTGKPAETEDLSEGTQFPEDENLIGELPDATVNDYEIHEPAWEDVTDTTIKLSWDAYPGAASYQVRIYKTVFSNAGIKYKVATEKTVTGTSAVMDGLDPLSWYYVVVQALDADDDIIAIYSNLLFQTADVAEEDSTSEELPDIDDKNNNVGEIPENSPAMGEPALVALYMAAAIMSLAVVLLAVVAIHRRLVCQHAEK